MFSIPATSQTGAVTCPRPTQLVHSRTRGPTPGRHSRVRPGAHRSSPSSYLSVVEPGHLLQAGAVTWHGHSRPPNQCTCEPGGKWNDWAQIVYGRFAVTHRAESRAPSPRKQKTGVTLAQWLTRAAHKNTQGELKPYPRPSNQNLWGGAQA